MNDQPQTTKSVFILIVGSILGLWLYVLAASFIGVIKEPFWWDGKGWFLPVFGTLAMVIGAVPLCYIAKWTFNRSTTLINASRLLLVGFFHGLVFLLALQLASLLIGAMVGLGTQPANIEIARAVHNMRF